MQRKVLTIKNSQKAEVEDLSRLVILEHNLGVTYVGKSDQAHACRIGPRQAREQSTARAGVSLVCLKSSPNRGWQECGLIEGKSCYSLAH